MSCQSYQGRNACDCQACHQETGGVWFGLAGATLLGLIVAVLVADELQPIRDFFVQLWEVL